QILAPSGVVDAYGLDVSVGVGANPHLLPGGRYHESVDACPGARRCRPPLRIDVSESGAGAHAAVAGIVVGPNAPQWLRSIEISSDFFLPEYPCRPRSLARLRSSSTVRSS